MPSAFSVSRAYSISFRLPSVSGRAPRRTGRSGPIGLDLLGGVIVPHPRQPPPGGTSPNQGRRRHRDDRGSDAVLVHGFERLARLPRQQAVRRDRTVAETDALVFFLHVLRRQEVVMHVDARAGCLIAVLARARIGGAARRAAAARPPAGIPAARCSKCSLRTGPCNSSPARCLLSHRAERTRSVATREYIFKGRFLGNL